MCNSRLVGIGLPPGPTMSIGDSPLKFVVSMTSVSPSNRPRDSPSHCTIGGASGIAPVDGHDARLMHELEPNDDVARRLHDLDAAVVHEREHRRRHAARDAAVECVEVRYLVERDVGPAARHRRRPAFAFGRQRRQAAVRGLHDQRSQPVRLAHLGPVADAHLVRGDLLVITRVQAAQALDALGELASVSNRRSPKLSGRCTGVPFSLSMGHMPCRSGSPHAVRGTSVARRQRRRPLRARFPAAGRRTRQRRPERAKRTSIGAVACSKPRGCSRWEVQILRPPCIRLQTAFL